PNTSLAAIAPTGAARPSTPSLTANALAPPWQLGSSYPNAQTRWRPRSEVKMLSTTLETTFAGIKCLNPFWLASAPPTNCGEQVMRAFDAGWGGAVWKTIGEPITNVSSRYSAMDYQGVKMLGFNNIELISDRPTQVNLDEIAEVKKRYPKHVVIASLMV